MASKIFDKFSHFFRAKAFFFPLKISELLIEI